MPEIVSCTNCQRKLRVPDDLLGKRVKCPGCGTTFTASAVVDEGPPPKSSKPGPAGSGVRRKADPVADRTESMEPPRGRGRDQDEERPRARADRDDSGDPGEDDESFGDEGKRSSSPREGWRKVLLGLTLHVTAIGVVLGGLVFGVLGGFLAAATGPSVTINPPQPGFPGQPGFAPGQQPQITINQGSSTLSTIVSMIVNMLYWGGRILVVVAYGFYILVPVRTGAKGFGMASLGTGIGQTIAWGIYNVLLFGLGLSLATLTVNLNMMMTAGIGILISFILAILLLMGELACSVLYFKTIATYLRNHGLANNLQYLLIFLAVIVFLFIAIIGVGFFTTGVLATSGGRGLTRAQGDAAGGIVLMLFGCCCLDIVASLAWAIWYMITVFLVRGMVERHVRRN